MLHYEVNTFDNLCWLLRSEPNVSTCTIERLAMADPDKLPKLLRELLDKTGMGPDEHKLMLTLKRQADMAIIKAYEERKKGRRTEESRFCQCLECL